MENDIYRRLQQHLDRLPIPFPSTQSGVELRLLKKLFTVEEAEIALNLSAIPEKISKIHTDSMPSVALIIDRLTKKAGVVYSYYLSGKLDNRDMLSFTINGDDIKSFDPLFVNEIKGDDKEIVNK